MRLFRILVFSAMLTGIAMQPTVFYHCIDDSPVSGSWIMDLFIRKEGTTVSADGIHGVILPAGTESVGLACGSYPPLDPPFTALNPVQEITGTGSVADPYKLKVEINSATEFLKPGSPDCGQENSAPGEYKWGIQVHLDSAPLPNQIRLRCDFTDASITETPSVSSVVDILKTPVIVQELQEAVRLSVVHGTTLQTLTVIDTFDVRLKMEFLTGPQYYAEPNAIGIRPHTCQMCDTVDCLGSFTVDLSDSDGCTVGDVFSVSAGLHAFTGDGVTLFSSPMDLVSLSLPANMISNVFFRCDFTYCTTGTTIVPCQNSCQTARRKKRDVEPVISQHRVHIDAPILSRQQGSTDRQSKQEVHNKCRANTGFFTTMVTLASIFVLAMLISIVQCVRLFFLRKEY